MNRNSTVLPLFAVFLGLLTQSAHAAPASGCIFSTDERSMALHDGIIAACTAIIDKPGGADDARMSAHQNRATSFRLRGEFGAAIADFDEAVRYCRKLRKCNIQALYNSRAIARLRKGDIENALSDLAEALRLDPNYALAYVTRGLVWWELGKPDMP